MPRMRSSSALGRLRCSFAICSLLVARKDAASADSAEAAGIHQVVLSGGDRGAIIERLRELRRQKSDMLVVDIGPSLFPWSILAGVVDAIVDLFAGHIPDCFSGPSWAQTGKLCCEEQTNSCFDDVFTRTRCCRQFEPAPPLLRFNSDITSPDGWSNILAHVEEHGRFDFAIVSHVMEDIYNPQLLAEMLPRVAKGGFIAVPSKYYELSRHTPSSTFDESGNLSDLRGSLHHRWVFTVSDASLVAIPKLPMLDADKTFDPVGLIGGDLSIMDMSVMWYEKLPFKVVNNGWLGFNYYEQLEIIRGALGPQSSDDVDALLRGAEDPVKATTYVQSKYCWHECTDPKT